MSATTPCQSTIRSLPLAFGDSTQLTVDHLDHLAAVLKEAVVGAVGGSMSAAIQTLELQLQTTLNMLESINSTIGNPGVLKGGDARSSGNQVATRRSLTPSTLRKRLVTSSFTRLLVISLRRP
eukprot:TRINITY_DN18712_c1_g3_i1.p1 TRINITY_DN18712_c1_g3~~TRINITY_DN18712_c1_g3_i1.p1  ORF type:complete len:133 (+),score=10.04 TRINITY_DN18712_c1_g3_i1:33-401(+)